MAVIRQRTIKAARGIESSGRSPCRSLRKLSEPVSGKLQAGKAGERGHVPRESRDLCLTAETTISISFPSLLEKLLGIQRSGQAGTGFKKRENLPSHGNGSGKGELSFDEFPSIVFHTV
jgi:hypothetical protein